MSVKTASQIPTPIKTVLVANRGEIARRVFATAHAMGMHCVAVYVDADSDAPFVRDADQAVRLPDYYLSGSAIIAAAKRTGADAIHPGYGFLSENAGFAQAVQEAGLTWVGPSPSVITEMGDKIRAKDAARAAEVPVLPSFDLTAQATTTASDTEYPLLVKAVAGGGGKGMRVVDSPADLADAVASAQREALKSFGDERVFLERYIANSRHIEIQILGDNHGNLVHLGERECSIQRRHQKIIEESPSPAIDSELRQAMAMASLRLAASLNYSSTGTVEFLVDDDSNEFYFLEVNTRLQVEHPVTEAVTGVDLVREQLRVAAGEPLSFGQSDLGFSGHAIEARLYAEDPANNFLPATGQLDAFEPSGDSSLRWDFGVEQGSVVGVEFDPMLGKVIAHADTRTEAAARLSHGLEQLHLGGAITNRDFLVATLRTGAFLSGATTTDFIQRVQPSTATPASDEDIRFAAIAGALWIQGGNAATATVLSRVPSGWRNARLPMEQTTLRLQSSTDTTVPNPASTNSEVGSIEMDSAEVDHTEATIEVHYRRQRTRTGRPESFTIGESPSSPARTATVHRWGTDAIDVELDGLRRTARVTRATKSKPNSTTDQLHVQTPSTTLTFSVVPRFTTPNSEEKSLGVDGGLVAPMPGSVLEVRVAPGDMVSAGQVVLVLEAMKMEHQITAPIAGQIDEVRVAIGQQVELGLVMVTMRPDEANTEEAS